MAAEAPTVAPSSGVLGRAAQAYVKLCSRRGPWLLLGLLASAALCAPLWNRLGVDARLEALLPQDTPSARAIAALKQRAGSSSPLYLLVESSDPALNRRLAAALLADVRQWPETRRALNRRDPGFFVDHRLYYLPPEEIDALTEEVVLRTDWARCDALPACVNLEDRPPPLEADAWRKRLHAVPEVQELQSVFGKEALSALLEQPADEPSGDTSQPGKATDGGQARPGELCTPDGRVCAVEALMKGDPGNLEYAVHILGKARAAFERVRPAQASSDLRMAVSGAYRNAPVTKAVVERDLKRVTAASLSLVVLVLLAQFRIGRALLLLLLPLGVGAAWTASVIALVQPSLNLISAFVLAVLAGIGIDFGVHLLTHYGSLREQGHDPEAALERTLRSLGASMTIATITTGSAFGALSAARFRGFAELGGLAALGVGLALLAFLAVFPPLVLTLHRLRPERGSPLRPWPLSPGWFSPPRRVAVPLVVGGLLLSALAGVVGRNLEFEHDFRKLRPQGVAHGIDWSGALHGTTRTAVYLLADDPKTLESGVARLRELDAEDLRPPRRAGAPPPQEPPIALLSPASFAPSDGPQRVAAIGRLRAALQDARRHADAELTATIDRYVPLTDISKPVGPQQLPPWARQWFTEQDGRFGTLGVLYTEQSGSDAHQMEALSKALARFRQELPGVQLASPVALLGEVIPALRLDTPRILGLALLGLLLGTLVVGRSLRRTLLVMAPTLLAAGLLCGAMVLLGLKVNLYNLLVFPLAFGIGIDGAVYLASAASGGAQGLRVSVRAILGSTATTAAGFVSIAAASNPGLVSLASVATLAMAATLLANLLWLVPLLSLFPRDGFQQ